MLRHKPEEFDLELDRYGAADISEVVQALNERLGEPIEEEDLLTAVEAGDRVRYNVSNGRIRALYGHSIDVDPGEACKPPELLYVGLGSRDAERAERYGLRAGRRRFLHLAKSHDEAHETGRRQARQYAVVTVYALDAWEQGINFYDRISLYLSDPIPTEFLEVGESHSDGHPPVEHGGRDRRPGGRGRSEGRGGRPRESAGRSPRRDRDERGESAERGSRGGRGDREDRGPREGRRGRDELRERDGRNERPRREPREERRPEPTVAVPVSESPSAAVSQAPTPSTPFGAGLADSPPPAPEPVKIQTPQPPPVAEPDPDPDPDPVIREESRSDSPPGPTFGAGL